VPEKSSELGEQLPLPLEVRPALGRGAFIVAAPNAAGVRFIDQWPDWPVARAVLHGPEGSGKSHLVEVWRAASGAMVQPAQLLTPDWVASLPPGVAVAVEDVDSTPPGETRDKALFALLERAVDVKAGALVLTGRTPPETWPVALSDLASRFKALLAFPLWGPDDALLEALARKLFADRQLGVPDAVITRMVRSLERTPAAIRDFVALADRRALAEHSPVTLRLVTGLIGAERGENPQKSAE
jgi:chromosomal replication initiation ATPase DnaA